MKDMKKIFAGITAVSVVFGMTACGSSGSDGGDSAETTAETTTTTQVTVAVNENKLEGEDAIVAAVAEKLREAPEDYAAKSDDEKVIKWLAHYDLNPSTNGMSKAVNLQLFEQKYGGSIKWYSTTWETRYSDLSTLVLGGEGIDFFPCDTAALPKGVSSGMFQAVDDIMANVGADMNSELWAPVKAGMEIYNFGGKHYELVNNITAENIVLYNKQTLEENNIEDPYERWKNGEWDWDAFKADLISYVDPDSDQYGLDGYWSEKALFLSAGVPGIEAKDGHLSSNLMDPTVEMAMNYGYDLYTNGLIFDRSLFEYAEQPQFMGEGKQLYYIIGAWAVQADPTTWSTKIPAENLGLAPVPSPKGSENYMAATLDGWCICKGAANPEGVVLFAECTLLANNDADAISLADDKLKADAKWSDELIAINKEINAAAAAHPVVDLSTGVNTDVASLTTDGGDENGLRGAYHGVEWSTRREEISGVIDMLLEQADAELQAAVNA